MCWASHFLAHPPVCPRLPPERTALKSRSLAHQQKHKNMTLLLNGVRLRTFRIRLRCSNLQPPKPSRTSVEPNLHSGRSNPEGAMGALFMWLGFTSIAFQGSQNMSKSVSGATLTQTTQNRLCGATFLNGFGELPRNKF